MIVALLLAATSAQGSVRTVELSRGAVIQSADTRSTSFLYWDANDTFIDSVSPDENFGGEPVLSGGPSKTILIRFGDLDRVLSSTRKVRKATLFLTIAGGDRPTLKSINRVQTPWYAGPYFTINALINRNLQAKADEKKIDVGRPSAPHLSATWRRSLSGDGGANWQLAGASGPQDIEPIVEGKGTSTDKTYVIEGLETAVQKMADQPYANFGFAVKFQNECEFFASRAAIGQPKLVLELEPEAPKSGPDLSVSRIERLSKSGDTPSEGEEVTYQAHVKNVGTTKSAGFSAVWAVNGKSGATFEVNAGIDPGSETTVTTHAVYRPDRTDHRAQTIGIKITPTGPDSTAGNNSLTVFQSARQVDVVVPESISKGADTNLSGTKAIEDWVQAQVRVFNDVYAAQSRYSFAPDGAKERLAVQHILFGNDKPSDGAHADATVSVPEQNLNFLGSDDRFMRDLAIAAGAPDFANMNIDPGDHLQLKFAGQPINRGGADLYPGIVGYGDTRYEGSLAGAMCLAYGPYPSSSPSLIALNATGLLSETDVLALNSRLDGNSIALGMPKTALLKVLDLSGRPLGNVQLDFYQSQGGTIHDGAPTFSLTSSPSEGTVLLPNRDGGSPFGKLLADGSNGTFLVKATANGVVDWNWVKAWQLIDTAIRGNTMAGIVETRFNLPSGPLDLDVNLVKDRIVTDSTNILPAKLEAIVSGETSSEVELGGKSGDWVEVDLGRDRTVGQISVVAEPGTFWKQFDIMVYTTGQKSEEANVWTKELDWNWTSKNRREVVAGTPTLASVGYCAPGLRIRFIRIVNRSNKPGKIRAIRVTPIKISQ